MAKIAANPFKDWSYLTSPQKITNTAYPNQPLTSGGPTRVNIAEQRPVKSKENPRRKRSTNNSTISPEPDSKRAKSNDYVDPNDAVNLALLHDGQVPLEKYYYATMNGDSLSLSKEMKNKIAFKVRDINIARAKPTPVISNRKKNNPL